MRTLNEREKKILFMSLTVMFIYLNIELLMPLKDKEGQLHLDIQRTEKTLANNLNLIKNESDLKAEYQKLLTSFVKKDSDEKTTSMVLSEIESLASKLGMRMVIIKPEKVNQIDFYYRFYIELTTEGQFKDIMHFLYALQGEPHFFKVEKMQMEKNKAISKITCHVSLSRLFVTVISK
jgi:Tfp pilus assembly protein PilO